MAPLKFAAVICLVCFAIFVSAHDKEPTCKTVLDKLDNIGGHLCQNADCDGTDVCPAIKTLEMKLENLHSLVDTVSMSMPTASSCKVLYDNGSRKSQVYPLMFGLQKIPVFCHMGNFGCGDGGWTLAMKIDGSKNTFHRDSALWSDRSTYNLEGGTTGFDLTETKLPTYWNTSFSKICLGMKIGQQINFIVIWKRANSLYSLIADGRYRATSLGRNKWKKLIGSQASLQWHCNKEGFNTVCGNRDLSWSRIGILSNNEKFECNTCDSKIGFGIGKRWKQNTCGNVAKHGGDNGDRDIEAMGYILVQ